MSPMPVNWVDENVRVDGTGIWFSFRQSAVRVTDMSVELFW